MSTILLNILYYGAATLAGALTAFLLSIIAWSLYRHFCTPSITSTAINPGRALYILDNFLKKTEKLPIYYAAQATFIMILSCLLASISSFLNINALRIHPSVRAHLGDLSIFMDHKLTDKLLIIPELWQTIMRHFKTIERSIERYLLPALKAFKPDEKILSRLQTFAQIWPIIPQVYTIIRNNNLESQVSEILAKIADQQPLAGKDLILCTQLIGKAQKYAEDHHIDLNPVVKQLSSIIKHPQSPRPQSSHAPVLSKDLVNENLNNTDLSNLEDQIVDTFDLITETSWQSCVKSTKNLVVGFVSSLSDYASKKLIPSAWTTQNHCLKNSEKIDSQEDKLRKCLSRPTLWRRVLCKSQQLHQRIQWLKESSVCNHIKGSIDWLLGEDTLSILNRHIQGPSEISSTLPDHDAKITDMIAFAAGLLSDPCISEEDYDTIANCLALGFMSPDEFNDSVTIDADKSIALFNKIKDSHFIKNLSNAQQELLRPILTKIVERWVNLNVSPPLTQAQRMNLIECIKNLIIDNHDDKALPMIASQLAKQDFSSLPPNEKVNILTNSLRILGKNEHLIKDHETLGICLDIAMHPASQGKAPAPLIA